MSASATPQEKVTTTETERKPRVRKKSAMNMAADIAMKALISKGATVREAAKLMNCSTNTIMRIRREMKETQEAGVGSVGPLSVERDSKVLAVIDRFLDAGASMPKARIKGSDVTTAVKVYADRRWPAKTDTAPHSLSFTQVFIGEARIEPPGALMHTTRGVEPPLDHDARRSTVEIEGESLKDNVRL